MLFPHYNFERPSTHELRTVRTQTYVLAALFASVYVWRRTDFRYFLRALPGHLLVLLAFPATVMVAAMLPLAGSLRLVAIGVGWVVLVLILSRMMVRVIVRYYARTGWEVLRD